MLIDTVVFHLNDIQICRWSDSQTQNTKVFSIQSNFVEFENLNSLRAVLKYTFHLMAQFLSIFRGDQSSNIIQYKNFELPCVAAYQI